MNFNLLSVLRGLALLLLVSAAATGRCADKVTLQLKWDHEFQFAGYYAAQWQGYYEAAGLDVEIRSRVRPDGSLLDIGEELAAGTVDFAVAGPDLLIYRDRGIPVVIIATIFQQSPYAFVTRKNEFQIPAEFAGKRVNSTEPSWGPVELAAVMRAVGGNPDSIIVSDEPPHLSLLVDNKVDVVATYLTSARWQMQETKRDFDVFTASDYGVYLYGDTLVTHQQMIDKQPDVVARFTKASLAGWRYALENIDEISARIVSDLERHPKFDFYEDFEAYNRYEAGDILKLTQYPTVSIGHTGTERWQKTLEYFQQAGHVTGQIEIDSLIYQPGKLLQARTERITRSLISVAVIAVLAISILIAWSYTLKLRVMQKTKELKSLNFSLEDKVQSRTVELKNELGEREKIQRWLTGYNLILKKIAEGDPLPDVLDSLVYFIQEQHEGMLGSIVLLDKAGEKLTIGSAPDLPQEYNDAINGVAIGPEVGSCGTAAFKDELVIAKDIASDPLWTDYKDVALNYNLKACWSCPIHDANDKVLGTFVLYFTEIKEPAEDELRNLEASASIAGIAISAHRAEETIRESEHRFRTLVEQAADAIFVHDFDGNIIDVNQASCHNLGYGRNELLSLNVADIEANFSLADLKPTWSALKPGAAIRLDGCHRRKDGTTFPIEVLVGLIDGEKPVILALARDMTSRKKVEEELLKIQKLESVGILAGGIAHDFNNLLTSIIGRISLIQLKCPLDDQPRKWLEDANVAAERAKNLTQQLLTFSRGGEPVKQTFDVTTFLREITNFSVLGAKSKCKLEVSPDIRSLHADKGQISQVLHNLIINADQAMTDGGTIDVTAENQDVAVETERLLKPGKYIKIQVVDEGCGFPEENLKKIFDPFFTTKKKGTGLGLATCFSIVNKHDGRIFAQSTVGIGSTFVVYLPACDTATSKSAATPPRPSKLNSNILLMDDEEIVRSIAEDILEMYGCDVVCAADGEQAIELYKNALAADRPFDVVILDLTIPGGMGGLKTNELLHDLDPTVKTIVSSGYSNDPVMSEFRKHGFSGIISKPYTVAAFLNGVRTVLEMEPPTKSDSPADD